ncbi:hypothetical protein Btru_016196 [Bulinus truncatus]|nr:hypothetical protein Btru_016196 [Bulinus truncatus]
MTDNLSRHELKILHRRLNEECHLLRSLHRTMREVLQRLHDGYIELDGVFPLFRYGSLKKVIKETVSEKCLEFLSKVSKAATQAKEDPLSGKLHSLQEIAGSEDANKDSNNSRPLVTGGKPSSKGKQAFRFFLKITGFDSEPIEDEDVMDDKNLRRNSHNMRRDLEKMYGDFIQASSALHSLKTTYEETKGALFLMRYYTLKRRVRDVISETKADTKYVIER